MTSNKPIKVTHIITGLKTGGAERALYNLLASDFSSKYECSVISLIDEGIYGSKIRALGIPVYPMNMRINLSIFRSLILLRSIVKRLAPNVLQGWMYHGNLAATVAKFFCNDKVSLAWNIRHSLYELKSENFATRQIIKMNKLLSNRADAIFYNSKISLTQHENFGFNSHSSILNPNGFDTNILKPSFETKELIRRELGILDNDTVIGHVARYHPMKDHITFVKALIKVMVERSDVVALMIGREVKSGTAFLINDLPETITSRFYFLGERSDVYDLMQSMDVLCLTSAWGEGFPNVLGEAMSMSIPCISTDIADSSEIIGDTGIVVPPGKPCSLADAIFAFLSMSSSEKVTLGRAARERIEKKFLMQVNVECYEAIYEKLSKLYASTK